MEISGFRPRSPTRVSWRDWVWACSARDPSRRKSTRLCHVYTCARIACPVAFTRCTSCTYVCCACATLTCHAMLARVTHMSHCETPGALGHLPAVVTGGTASFGGGNGVPPLPGLTLGEGCEGKDGVVVAGDGGQHFWGHARVLVLGGSPLATRRGFAHRACCVLGPKHSRRPQRHHKGVAGEICPNPNPPLALGWLRV